MSTLDYSHTVPTADGGEKTLDEYKGKALLIVNTATHCGFTPQLDGLEALQAQYGDKGFAVLGFPSNEFGKQSPGSNEEIAEFCRVRFGTTFESFGKVQVNGSEAHPLWAQLKAQRPGILGSQAIKWNFTKFLVAPDGTIVSRHAPNAEPSSLAQAIEAVLPEAG